MKKIISFINQKGGVGKTTMCFNLAFAMKEKGHRVLVIDLDPQANLTMLVAPQLSADHPSILSLMINQNKDLKSLHRPYTVSDILIKGEIDLLPSAQELSGFDLTFSLIRSPRQLVLKKCIEMLDLKNRYDYIFIDCPPTLGLLVINALCASDGIIVPFRADDFSKRGLEHLYEVLNDIEDMSIVKVPEVLIHVPNMIDSRRKQENTDLNSIIEVIEKSKGEKTIGPKFSNKSLLIRSVSEKNSVFNYHSKDFEEIQNDFLKMARQVEEWNKSSQY